MPANQGQTGPDWSPRPDIRPHEELDPVPLAESYRPRNFEDCVRYVIECASIPDVDIYSGLPEAQRGIAEHIAAQVYKPRQNVVAGLKRLFEQQYEEECPPSIHIAPRPSSAVFEFQNRKPKVEGGITTHYGATRTLLHVVPEPSPILKKLRRSRVSA